MKFKKFVENCNKLLEEKPETGEYETVYARDYEGNGFDTVYNTPLVGVYKDKEWYSLMDVEEEDWGYTKEDLNSVCIN